MKLDHEMIDKIAHLARLEIAEAEKEVLLKDMNKILNFMDKLNEIDTSNVAPLIYMNEEEHVLRDDELKQEITTEEALQNSPQHDGSYFKVAKVIKTQSGL